MPKTENSLESTLAKLRSAKDRVVALEEKLVVERRDSLSNLHETVGFESRDALIDALQQLIGSRPAGSGASAKPRAKRTRISPEMRAEIVKALKAGQTGVVVAQQFGISNPSLHNIKKAAGLVKDRAK